MSAASNVSRLQPGGTPRTLMENALDEAHDMQFALMVFVRKDGTIETEWSHLPNSLQALGAIELLRHAIMEQAF
jgi:hypothetical protein